MPGIFDTGIFDTGIFDHAEVAQSTTPSAGWSNWLDNLPRPYQADDEPEPKPKKRKKKRAEPEKIFLAPDPVIQRGIVNVRPAWDVMAELQAMADEAALARAERLRALALADDEWMMTS